MTTELLQAVRLLDPGSGTDETASVLIVDGIIQAIAPDLSSLPTSVAPAPDTIIPAQGYILGPGLVDLYSHSGQPGFEERETLASLLQAAAAGGFTRLALLPNTVPAIDNPASVAWLHETHQALSPAPLSTTVLSGEKSHSEAARPTTAAASAWPTLYPWAAITQACQGQRLTELGELAAANIAGFTDGQPLPNLALVQRLLEYLRPSDRPIALWPCTPDLMGHGVVREGPQALRFGLPGIPDLAETAALAVLLECVATFGTPIHLMRISTARSVAMIEAAKARGLPITASTPWMHLLLSTEDVGRYDPHLHLSPPLGNPSDRQALVKAVQTGVIDAIAIDHRAYTYEEKTVAFAEAPAGAIGLELALPLLWHGLVATGQLSAVALWRALSSRPAACLRQPPPGIRIGAPAEMTLFDPQPAWTVDGRSLRSLAANTPWWQQIIQGRVIKTWVPAAVR